VAISVRQDDGSIVNYDTANGFFVDDSVLHVTATSVTTVEDSTDSRSETIAVFACDCWRNAWVNSERTAT